MSSDIWGGWGIPYWSKADLPHLPYGGPSKNYLVNGKRMEPYNNFERTEAAFHIGGSGGTPEELALSTDKMYSAKSRAPQGQERSS